MHHEIYKETIIQVKLYTKLDCCFRVVVVPSCCVSMDVRFVLFLFFVSIHVCVCLQVQGPVRGCPWAGRFRDSLLLHTTWYRSYCTWRADCVAT